MSNTEPTNVRLTEPIRISSDPPVQVGLNRTTVEPTDDQAFWAAIRHATNAISFDRYKKALDVVMCGGSKGDGSVVERLVSEAVSEGFKEIEHRRSLPFPRVHGYNLLKVSTEAFLELFCGVNGFADDREHIDEPAERARGVYEPAHLRKMWKRYKRLDPATDKPDADDTARHIIPYLDIVRAKLGDVPIKDDHNLGIECYGILRRKLTNPCMIELIWSYWMEEGMVVQAMSALSMRFQNRRGAGDRDPLANLEIDPLRPLNNLLWGFIQDEQHRLSVLRRAYEYDHHYGITLQGKAIPRPRTADSRSKFLEAFHNLLSQCAQFFLQDDDTTRIADGFPLLNGLKEVHLLLTQGGHNQYGDLPWTARQEMMMIQWLLARPEMREFIGGRIMVAYPEPWMDRVDAMKTLQGWTDTPITHFRDLAVFGEQILLSIRFGAWSRVNVAQQAANWARYWRAEIQSYLHAYRAATGVDLVVADEQRAAQRYLPPSIHLRQRLAEQERRR